MKKTLHLDCFSVVTALVLLFSSLPIKAADLAAKMKDPKFIEAGKAIYKTNCLACHAADGGGGIGPNFTDKNWIHGNKPEDLIKVITKGVPAKGMIAWGPILGPKKTEQVTAYILSLQGTTAAKPKEAQGKLYP